MSYDGLSRGIPVQDLPENQDPSVRYTLDEMTGMKTQWDKEQGSAISEDEKSEIDEDEKPEPKKRPVKKASSPAKSSDGGDDDRADDEGHGVAGAKPSEKSMGITSVRETGS